MEVTNEAQWTPEQQAIELKRRMAVLSSDLPQDVSSFKPNPNDVIVAIPSKNGTTWVMHICHQVRMKGLEPDFTDQLDVITWIEASQRLYGLEPASKPQPARPHIFVTHLSHLLIPRGGKLICCYRDQKDAVLSAYHFLNSKLCLKGRVLMPTFADLYLELQVKKHLDDLIVWWEHRNDKNVLLLFFDDLKEDHEGCVRRIAKFMGVDCDDDVIARVVHTTSHAEMVRHHSKFSSRRHTIMVAKKLGEEPPSESEFVGRVRKSGGRSGEGQEQLPPEVQQRIDQLWKETVTAKLGFENLEAMRESWKRERSVQ